MAGSRDEDYDPGSEGVQAYKTGHGSGSVHETFMGLLTMRACPDVQPQQSVLPMLLNGVPTWLARRLAHAALLGAVAGLVACGSSGSPSPSPARSSTPSPSAAELAVLHAYQAESAAFLAAVQIPDPAYPGLAATAVNPLLQQVRQSLVYDKEEGIVGRGSVQLLHPHVVSITSSTAVVQDCEYSSLILVYKSTGQPVPNQPGGTKPEYDGIKSTVTLVSGAWKVSAQNGILGSCPAGY